MQRSTAPARSFAGVIFFAAFAAVCGEATAEPNWPTAGWPVSSPEAQGMSSSALADLVDFGAASGMDSVLLVRHGTLVLDATYAPFQPGMKHLVNSVTKGVVGALVGIARQEGTIDRLDAPVLGFFGERRVANASAEKSAMTLQHLLDMTSGLDWQEPLTDAPPETMLQMERSADWVGFVLDRPMAQAPGVGFNYDSGTWHLLSAIVARTTGTDTLAYAKQKLFAPLGIDDVAWRRDPQGVPLGGYGLYLQPRDMAKIGYLYLHGGRWGDRQLLPPAFVDKVFRPGVDMQLGTAAQFRYANGWWSVPEKGAYMAVGFLRQLIIVMPATDTVAVVTGRRNYPMLPLIDRLAAAAASPGPLPADAAGNDRLAERVRAAAIETATSVRPAPALARAVSGKTYRLAENWIRLATLKLDLTAADPRYAITFAGPGPAGAGQPLEGPIGLDGLFRVSPGAGTTRTLAVKGQWLADDRFQIVSRSLLEGIVTTLELTFRGGRLDLLLRDNRGLQASVQGELAE